MPQFQVGRVTPFAPTDCWQKRRARSDAPYLEALPACLCVNSSGSLGIFE